MINLIPPEGQKVVHREYVLRVASTIGVLLGVVFLILGIGRLPTYVLVSAQIEAMNSINREGDDGESLKQAEAEIKYTKEILAQLRSGVSHLPASAILKKVESLAPSTLTLKSFGLGYTKGSIDKVTITGMAPTREVLVRFKKDIEADEQFLAAEVPIADLAKDSNLPFTMTVTLSPQS